MNFFTADHHFGTESVISKMMRKGFADIKEHDAILMDRINSKVGREDRLYIIGDFSDHRPGKYRPMIRCRHVFIVRGNHDPYMKTKHAFGELPWWRRVKFGGTKAILHHFPTIYWDGSHKGWYHLYGHTHARREATLDAAFPGRRSIDVGVDNARRLLGDWEPFSEQEILFYLADQPGHDPIDFYKGLDNAS